MSLEELENAIENNDKFLLIYKDPDFMQINPNVSPHMYIMIPYNDENCVILNVLTSSKFYERNTNEAQKECVIKLKAGDFSFITKDCIIDCNNCFLKTKNELIQNNAILKDCEKLPQKFLQQIKQKIKKSPLVKKKIKKNLL